MIAGSEGEKCVRLPLPWSAAAQTVLIPAFQNVPVQELVHNCLLNLPHWSDTKQSDWLNGLIKSIAQWDVTDMRKNQKMSQEP